MKKTKKKTDTIPDITEYIDETGQKWVQTSTDDLFSLKELNDIIESVEKEKNENEVILASFNFQKVNREYYNTVQILHKKLQKQTELLKRLSTESRVIINKKNTKLKELIEYIKKLHLFIAYLNENQEAVDSIKITPDKLTYPIIENEELAESVYEEVEEVILTKNNIEKLAP